MASNRFDFLRLLFAFMVCLFHIVALAALDVGGPWERGLGRIAELSIQGFFIISGALVLGSLERSSSLLHYGEKRGRRLYPAYFIIILIPALFALAVSGQVSAALQYIAANLIFLNFLMPDLPGLFKGNEFTAVNGALWTLKIEVMFYIALPVLLWMLKKAGQGKFLLLILIYIAAEIWRIYFDSVDPRMARQLPGQMSFFAAGMGMWLLWAQAKTAPLWALLAGLGLTLVSIFIPALESLRALGLASLISYIAFVPGPALNAARYGDVSYGLYIIHFPIIQTLIALGVFAASPALGIGLSITLVISLSFVLWHFVEQPFLHKSSHYRRTQTQIKDT